MKILWRDSIRKSDPASVCALVREAGVFNEEEIQIAGELVMDRVTRGEASEYHFIFAEAEGELIAYTCYGRICFTDERYDLYWIAVSPRFQGQGIAAEIMERTEQAARALGCKHLYAETSSREVYAPARKFYLRQGFAQVASLKDFYRDGDDKVLFRKYL